MKVAIIGAGTICAYHVNAYRAAGAEVVAICDRRLESAEARAAEFSVPKAYDDTAAMLRDGEIDAVSVATPVSTHKALVLEALRAGKHVFCEKPPAMTADDVREMIAARDAAGRVLQFGFVNRFKDRIAKLRTAIEGGLLGRPIFCEAGRISRCANPGGWFADRRFTKGGTLFDAAIHEIDAMLYVLGYPRIASVRAFMGHENADLAERLGKRGYVSATAGDGGFRNDVETYATVFLVTEAGYPLLVRSTGACGAVTEGAYVRLTGTEGGAEIPGHKGAIRAVHLSDAGFEMSEIGEDGDAFAEQMRHFVASCEQGVPCIAHAEDALALMELYDAIYLSADEGREVLL